MKIFLSLLLLVGACYVTCFKSELAEDIDQILALIPKKQLVELMHKNDESSNAEKLIKYMETDYFRNGIFLLKNHPDLKEIHDYLDDNGVNVYQLFGGLFRDISNEFRQFKKQPLVNDLAEKEYALHSLQNILATVMNKLILNPSFRHLYNLIHNLDYDELYEDLMNWPEIEQIVFKINEIGINTEYLWMALSYVFGWGNNKFETNFSTFSDVLDPEFIEPDTEETQLLTDLNEFLALVPQEKFYELMDKYLTNPIFQKLIKGVAKKNNLKVIHTDDMIEEVVEFIDFLEDNGVQYLKLWDKVRNSLGINYAIKNLPNGTSEVAAPSDSLRHIFKFAMDLLPMEKIKDLSKIKLINSEEYKEFHKMFLDIIKEENIQLFLKSIENDQNSAIMYGVNTLKGLQLLSSIFGVDYKAPLENPSLTNSLYEFFDVIPKVKYDSLYHKYKENDNIWKIVRYFKGPLFGKVVHSTINNPGVKIVLDFLLKFNVPYKTLVVDLLQQFGILQWWINYDYYCGTKFDCTEQFNPNADDINNFIQKRLSLFPLKELLITLNSKLGKNDVEFENLFLEISNINGTEIANSAINDNNIRNFLVNLNSVGYDTHKIWELIRNIFKWDKVNEEHVTLKQSLTDFFTLISTQEFIDLFVKYENEITQMSQFFQSETFLDTITVVMNMPDIRNIIDWMEKFDVPVMHFINLLAAKERDNTRILVLDSKLKWSELMADIKEIFQKNQLSNYCLIYLYSSIQFDAFFKKIYSVDYHYLHTMFLEHHELHFTIDRLNAFGLDFTDIIHFIAQLKLYASYY